MTDIVMKRKSLIFSGLPCHIQPDKEPVTENKSQHGNPQQELETLKMANDQNNNTSQSNAELQYEGIQSPSKDPHSKQFAESTRSNTKTFTIKKEGKHSSKDSSPSISCKTVFEKWAILQDEEHRPSTKRQLSAESASKCVSVSKKSTSTSNKKEVVKPHSPANPGTQPRKACLPIRSSSQRRSRKQLFSSTGVFLKVDSHAISTGRKLKEQGVFSAQSIAHAITQGAKDDLEKIRAIWVWLCHYIEYDLEGYLGNSPKLCTPEEVIKEGRGLCSGFSSICLNMCRAVSIQCEEVSGYSKGIGHWPGQRLADKPSDHMWNAVWVRGQWGLLDACWGAGTVNKETETFIKRFDDFYFLTEPTELINSHFPDDENWQLLDNPVSLEQFEQMPIKTSAFFNLGLTLLQPTQHRVTTDDGETTVSMSSCRPMTFAYELRQWNSKKQATGQSEVDGSCGLLSVTKQGMNLRLLPPESGDYQLKLFARPEGDSGTLLWVCTLELDCPAVQQSQPLPGNPYLIWGLGSGAGALGVKGCNVQGKDALEVCNAGECDVVLYTSRPLMMVCELIHPSLDPALSKRCLALQISTEKLVCNVLCPYKGYYRLSVFIRDYDDGSGSFQNVGNFLLRHKGPEVKPNMLHPSDLGPWCGPGIRTQAAGLFNFSHTGALVNMPQGRCNITFHFSSPEQQIHAVLDAAPSQKDQKIQPCFPLSRYVLLTVTDSKVTVSVSLPGPGVYRLGLYGRALPQQDYTPLCDYVLRSACDRCGDPFPFVYSGWGKGCVLLEPRVGLLSPQSWVRFRVRVPSARRVSVLGEGRADLSMNKSRVWEGEVFTGKVTQVRLTTATSDSNDMVVLMTFDVSNLESET